MKKIRLSYSLLSLWERNDIDGAVRTYFHMDGPVNEAMKNGKRLHQEIEKHILAFNTFPPWFFEYDLKLPETEKEVVVDYNEMFTLKGIFDCIDRIDGTLFEFKTGNTDALAWARTWQLPIYFLIAELAKIEVKKAFLIQNNGQRSEFVIVHNTKGKRDDARNRIDSLGPEIHSYFEREGLI
jgi:hypothetical protein